MYEFGSAKAPGPVSVYDQKSNNSAWAQANAYLYAATGETKYLNNVVGVMQALISPSLQIGRALALAREVQGYVAAAEGVALHAVDADLYRAVKTKFKYFLTCNTPGGGPTSLTKSMEQRPNNWGTHATAAVMMIARYIGDDILFARAQQIYRGWLGEYETYHDFIYGDLAWQWHKDRPVGINGKNAVINGLNVDGMMPEEARRGTTSTSALPGGDAQMYSWEAAQGATAAMAVALNAGIDLRNVADYAHKRSINFNLNIAHWPIGGDDCWQGPVLNKLYPELKLVTEVGSPGKGLSWTHFTHLG